MSVRATADLPGIYRGDDWDVLIGFYASGGGLVGDVGEGMGATLAASSDQLVLPTGVKIKSGARTPRDLNAGDIGTQVTLMTGAGFADGTTITDVALDGRSATLSATSSADRDGDAAVIVRAKDLTDFTITGQVRDGSEDAAVLFTLPLVDDRYAFGVLEILMYSRARATILGLPILPTGGGVEITDRLTKAGIYDLQFVDSAGVTSTPLLGKVPFVKDRTHT